MEITSPGGIMPSMTLDIIKEGYSKIQNSVLAHAFSYMNLIEGQRHSEADGSHEKIWTA